MTRFVVRVWLPDKPGALGRVASAIGSIGASLIGIDILEQDGGYAIDELIVEAVASENIVDKLVAAMTFVEGVNVEDIRETRSTDVLDPRLDALETAAALVEQDNSQSLVELLVHRAAHDLATDWGAMIVEGSSAVRAAAGAIPSVAWLRAFLAGTRTSTAIATAHRAPDDIAWAELGQTNAVLVLGRDGRPFRSRERRQLTALARIADRRLFELS